MKPSKKFAKIYAEITTVCNLKCEFCHGTKREAVFVAPETFALRAEKIARYTDHVYLHVMGEPLLHPRLGEIIDLAAQNGLKVSITTNGTLLEEKLPLLLERAEKLYKISISLHSFEGNLPFGGKSERLGDMNSYLDGCFFAAEKLGKAGVIAALRLWNLEGLSQTAPQNSENAQIIDKLKSRFPDEWSENRSGMKIGNRVYLEWGERFDWPDMSAPEGEAHGFCYAMKDHVAVLSDGRVVPCCLDADGEIPLGNIDNESLDSILDSPKARAICDGFAAHSLVHPLCRRCGFAKRW